MYGAEMLLSQHYKLAKALHLNTKQHILGGIKRIEWNAMKQAAQISTHDLDFNDIRKTSC